MKKTVKKSIPIRFKPQEFESKWQKKWEESGTYSPDMMRAKKPFYNLMMFPYPSAEGLHVGNMYAFTGVDVFGRFKRMQGFDVFEPIGLDGFGIHSENYALKVNRHPKEQAKISEANFYRQLRNIGNSFDWTRTVETYDPDYYKWTQWLFVQMFKHGLAYRAKAEVNWCPSCKTVLADEQVIDEKCERCGSIVVKKELEQWFFKITVYAERLLQNTYKPSFKWSEKVRIGQQNWIGKKTGINITYPIADSKKTVTVWTSRPDTNFGATFIVISPEHPEVLEITSKEQSQRVKEYINKAKSTSDEDRIASGREKTGAFTGSYAINHLTQEKMPIYVADFVLMGVGTGVVVGVPGHDLRDFEFAQAFNLPIKRVVVGIDNDTSEITRVEQVQEESGKMINSDFLNGLEIHDATEKIMDYFEKKGWGKRVTSYHLRDWLISRQRYWGAPIPMIYCEKCASEGKSWFTVTRYTELVSESSDNTVVADIKGIPDQVRDDNSWAAGWFPTDEEDLPVLLPDVENWRPTGTGRGPLAGVPEFYETKCPECGEKAVRETDVCDTFLDSSWYFMRYPSVKDENSLISHPEFISGSKNADQDTKMLNQVQHDKLELPWNLEITKRWLPVNSYIGGAEHTVLHLLYARFVWMVLRDMEYLPLANEAITEDYNPDEPFVRFFAHGLIIKDGTKMSKSKGNVVVPDEYIKLYGADTLRTYLMFLGPFEGGGDFRDTGIAGMYRWLSRVWRLVQASAKFANGKSEKARPEELKILHKTIKGVSEDIEGLRYNTAIAKLMEFTNWWMDQPQGISYETLLAFLKLLAPFAPFMTEELWQKLSAISLPRRQAGNQLSDNIFESIHMQDWPQFDPNLIKEETVIVVVQVNGKIRDSFSCDNEKSKNQSAIEQISKSSAKVQKYLAENKIKKIIFVPGKLINFVY
ncbi:leucine--tRNA ligase [Candidatus Microgenomates bacterium]|nr:MAG: leucine--tRNA ligase [Candidatus Microgenomates bacterium]